MSLEPAISSFPITQSSRVVGGRYYLFDEIAAGGMASVHFGRLVGAVGFSRTVAIKYLHPHYSQDAEFVSMFVDEARLAARIQHPNVAAPLDVVLEDTGEIFLVMEYIHGETLGRLLSSARSGNLTIPLAVSASIMSGALHGLHAAHEAVNEQGEPLGVVHRDISPQNIMVGVDGVARVLDFGVAKAVSRIQSTRQGQLKGKLSYMAPEQMRSDPIDRRLDIFAAGIVLWEALTHRRLFKPDDAASAVAMILHTPIRLPSSINPQVPFALDRVVMKALDRNVKTRFQTAREFADAIEEAIPLASQRKVGEWVQRLCSDHLSRRAERMSEIERSSVYADLSDVAEELGAAPMATSLVPPPANLVERPLPGQSSQLHTSTNGEIVGPSSPDLQTTHISWAGRSWPWIAAASALVLLVGLAFVRTTRPAASLDSAQAQGVPASVPSARPTARPGPQPPSVAHPPAVPERPAVSAGATDLPAEAPTAAAPKVATPNPLGGPLPGRDGTTRLAPSKAAKGGKPSAKVDCDPPYYIDREGIRRVKSQCF